MRGDHLAGGVQSQLVISDHARIRAQQRGIPLKAIEALYTYGTRQYSRGEYSYSMDKRARRRMDRAIGQQLAAELAEMISDLYIIVGADEPPIVITVAHQMRRKRR